MKKMLIAVLIALTVIKPIPVKADTILHTAKATAYCLKGTTATGTTVTEGRTVASKPEWFNKTMVIYEDTGDGAIHAENYLGTYKVEDTGGEPIKKGYVVDVYISDYIRAKEFGCKDILALVIDTEGM